MNEILIFTRPNVIIEKYSPPVVIEFNYNGDLVSSFRVPTKIFRDETSIDENIIKINLPTNKLYWNDAINAIKLYMMPYSIGDIKKMKEKTQKFKIQISTFAPLYFLAKKMNLTKLISYLEISIYNMSFQNAAMLLLSFNNDSDLFYSDVIGHIVLALESSPPLKIYLSSLHFAEIILNFQKRKNHEFVCKWLLSPTIFNEFKKTKNQFNDVFQIVQNLPPLNPTFAYAIWIYSQFFPSIKGNEIFLPVIDEYNFDDNLPLSESQIRWVFENRYKEGINPSIIPQVVPYIQTLSKTNPNECSKLFQSVISITSFDAAALSTNQLIDLLPLAANPPTEIENNFGHGNIKDFYDSIFNQISNELKKRGITPTMISDNQKALLTLSWDQMFNTFHIQNDIFIEMCYKWLKRRKEFNQKNIKQFNSLFPEQSDDESGNTWVTRYSYILFRIFDILQQNNQNDLSLILRHNLTQQGYEKLFLYLLEKRKPIKIDFETLNIIHERTKYTKNEQILFTKLIHLFSIKNYDIEILLPVYKENLADIITLIFELKTNSQNENYQIKNKEYEKTMNTLMSNITSMSKAFFEELQFSSISALATLIPFNTFFGQISSSVVKSITEDKVLVYAIFSDQYQPLLINIPQLSLRAISLLSEPINFQYDLSKNSPIKYLQPSKMNFNYRLWLDISIPRFKYHPINALNILLMAKPKENLEELFKKFFAFIGIENINIFFINEDFKLDLSEDPVLIIKPLNDGIDTPIKHIMRYLHDRNFKVLINANALKSYISEDTDFMNNAFDFEEDQLTQIRWNKPPPIFLPSRENLPIFSIPDDHNDIYYHSISCRLKREVQDKIEMENHRLFAAKLNTNFSVFNYDIAFEGDNNNIIYWACIKQMILTTLTLLTNNKQK